MKGESRKLTVVIMVTAIIVVATVSVLFAYSGMTRPLTVVESKSMQHSDDTSYVGVIDTGDMVVMVSPDKASITTYVEGEQNGYSKFGASGDVMIYYRQGKNPVIHRAILWLDYDDATGRWSSQSLKDYPSDRWMNAGTWDDLTGILTLYGLPGNNGTSIDVSVDLDTLAHHSGYLTKGDNNNYFDQNTIHLGLVEKNELKAVAGIEIPWIGCIKLLINHKNVSMIPENSVPCLFLTILDIFMFLMMVSTVMECLNSMRRTG